MSHFPKQQACHPATDSFFISETAVAITTTTIMKTMPLSCRALFTISVLALIMVRSTNGLAFQNSQSNRGIVGQDLILPTSDPVSGDVGVSRRAALRRTAAIATSVPLSQQLILPTSVAGAVENEPIGVPSVPTVKLGKSNLEVSRTIQGCWQLAGGHGPIVESDALANMEAHFAKGITTLDTADIYGISECVLVSKLYKSERQLAWLSHTSSCYLSG